MHSDGSAHIEIRETTPQVHARFQAERRAFLVGVEDDMWAARAEMAEPKVIVINDVVAGSFSIDDENQLHALHIHPDLQEHAADALTAAVESQGEVAIIASTMDPGFLSLCLGRGMAAEPVALVYEHTADPQDPACIDLRTGEIADHQRAVDFSVAATGSPTAFLDPYLAERIEKRELFLMEEESGNILAVGESRLDTRFPGHTHLGIVVGCAVRGRGIGTHVMTTLVQTARDQQLAPHCSTGPTNVDAQRTIHRAGFRTRHRVFRIPTPQNSAN